MNFPSKESWIEIRDRVPRASDDGWTVIKCAVSANWLAGLVKKGACHGTWWEISSGGRVVASVDYDDGMKCGTLSYYDEMGRLQVSMGYENDIPHGLLLLFRSGRLVATRTWSKGQLHGAAVVLDDVGYVGEVKSFVHGIECGWSGLWDASRLREIRFTDPLEGSELNDIVEHVTGFRADGQIAGHALRINGHIRESNSYKSVGINSRGRLRRWRKRFRRYGR